MTKNTKLLSDNHKKNSIQAIITFFEEERDEQIGVIAAEGVLTFFIEEIGKEIYNKGITDAISTLKEKTQNLELDIESLKK